MATCPQAWDGKKFVIGGIEIELQRCCRYSDADVVIHVICDALLGR